MSLSDSIVGILKRITGDVSKRETNTRVLGELTPKEKLGAIFAEISETVLPRALTFKIDEQTSLAMDVGGRRLLRILKIEPGSLASASEVAFTVRNEPRLKQQVEAISELFAAFVKIDGALAVTSGEPSVAYSANEVGFTEQELREICDKLNLPDNNTPATSQSGSGKKKPPETSDATAQAGKQATSKSGQATKAEPASKTTATEEKKKPAVKSKQSGKPVSKPRSKAATGKAVKAFLDANATLYIGTAVISPDGKLNSTTGAPGENPNWSEIVDGIRTDLDAWVAATGDFIGAEQLVVLKSPGLSNQSMCFLYLDGTIVAAKFQNSELARILSSVSQILGWQESS